MKAVLYARVSSEKQAEKDLSISAQLKALRKYAADKGYDIVREFVDEAESARTANRPEFQEMIALAKSKPKPFDVILVWKLSRFARNREDSIVYKSLLRKRGIQVVSINERFDDGPAGELLEGIIEVVDEYYSANLSQDTKRGLKENAQRGFCNGGVAPFGFKFVQVSDGRNMRKKLEPDPETAPVVEKIFDECMSGKGGKEIAKLLNEQRVFNRSGKPWSKMAVIRILRNPINIGKYIYARHRKLKPGEERFEVENFCPPIIVQERFEAVQRLLDERTPAKHHPRRISSEYMLSGMLICGKCGRAMQGGSAKSGRFHYYGCYNHLRKGKSVCDARMVNAGRIERAIVEKLKERVLTPKNLQELLRLTNEYLRKRSSKTDGEVAAVEKQTAAKQRKLDRLYEALEAGTLALGDLAPRIKMLKSEIDDLKQAVSSARLAQSSAKEVRSMSIKELQRYVDDLYELLSEGTVFERRTFLSSFIQGISVDYPKVSVVYTLPLAKKPPFTSEVLSLVTKSGLYGTIIELFSR